MAMVARLLVHKHNKHTTTDDIFTADGGPERHNQLANISSSWKKLFTLKHNQSSGYWVPTLSGIIKAGDEGLVSSALFTTLQGQPGDLPLEALYDAFANELRTRPLTERSAYSTEISKFLAGTRRGVGELRRAKSVSQKSTKRRQDVAARTQRKSLDFSAAERGLTRSISMKRPPPVLVSMVNGLVEEGKQRTSQESWMKHGQIVEYRDGRMALKITTAEAAALSVILGSPLGVDADTDLTTSRRGAFGISISSRPTDDGKQEVTLRQHKRSIPQQHARGSGFSTLYAKHLAAGFLPLSQQQDSVDSIFITHETFKAIQTGASLYRYSSTTKTPQSDFLTSLPSARKLNFYTLAASTEQHTSATLVDAIAALPFSGGHTPLASAPLIETVQFIASGGMFPGRLLQRLEGLVDKVHRQAPHLNVFGPIYEPQHAGLLYRERERLGRLATSSNIPDTLADKAARMSRYITLLERLMALVPDTKPQDVLATVREATKVELQRSYADAVTAHNTPSLIIDSRCPESDLRSKRQSTASRASARRSNRSSTASTLTATSLGSQTASSDSFPPQNLGKQMERVLKSELPLSVESVAFVARMVIVAWTLSVERTAWEEGESGFRVVDGEALGEKVVLC
ncbi:Nn.00g075810.m01.CDS01 [Neocucurbitaria sp. VM-36]